MSGILHICTTDSLAAGLEDIPPFECILCGQPTMIATWCGPYCRTCGAQVDGGVGYSIGIARRKMGLTRKQWADMMGVKPKTVSVYDHSQPSKRYVDAATKAIKNHFGSAGRAA